MFGWIIHLKYTIIKPVGPQSHKLYVDREYDNIVHIYIRKRINRPRIYLCFSFLFHCSGDPKLGRFVYEGKTKIVYEIPGREDYVVLKFKDSQSAGDGARVSKIEGKSVLCNTVNGNVFRLLNYAGKHLYDTPIWKIPECICTKSHNAKFCNRNVHMCAHFCCKMVHCGIFVSCIVGYVRWVYTLITYGRHGVSDRKHINFLFKSPFTQTSKKNKQSTALLTVIDVEKASIVWRHHLMSNEQAKRRRNIRQMISGRHIWDEMAKWHWRSRSMTLYSTPILQWRDTYTGE